MPEKHKALFRGATNTDGTPAEWLGTEPGSPAVLDAQGQEVTPAVQPTPAVPARHLTQDEYDALSPRNKERVREAKNAFGEPLYEVRSEAQMKVSSAKNTTEGGE